MRRSPKNRTLSRTARERGETRGPEYPQGERYRDAARTNQERRLKNMEALYSCCAGLDVHKRMVMACVLKGAPGTAPTQEIKSFGTMSSEVLEMGQWLKQQGVSHVAMEATGSFWMPIYNLLEEQFALVVANAAHIKAVPGRKTDVKDAQWIADLLRHGLLRASYVPSREQRDLRELTRHRSSLAGKRAQASNELQKALESANIKLQSVVSDITGVS